MGPESGISFNGAVRSWILRLGTRTKAADKDKIPPLLKVSPPATMSTLSFPPSPGSPSELVPPEKLLTACADRFFEQVHCFYWLYSSEYFYTRLETTYSGDITRLSGSWLCSLQSLVALVGPSEASLGDGQRVTESLEKAKALVPRVCDESDLDSIRALILLVSRFSALNMVTYDSLLKPPPGSSSSVEWVHQSGIRICGPRCTHSLFAGLAPGQVLNQRWCGG